MKQCVFTQPGSLADIPTVNWDVWLTSKADICSCERYVRYGPKADIGAQISRQKIVARPKLYFERLPILNLARSVVASWSTV
jgi:hypothetical protein